jgi:hypothetical protein
VLEYGVAGRCMRGEAGAIKRVGRAQQLRYVQRSRAVPCSPAITAVHFADLQQRQRHAPHLLPRRVLISPLWAMVRMGWARPQLGKVLVEKRLCTMAMYDLQGGQSKGSRAEVSDNLAIVGGSGSCHRHSRMCTFKTLLRTAYASRAVRLLPNAAARVNYCEVPCPEHTHTHNTITCTHTITHTHS